MRARNRVANQRFRAAQEIIRPLLDGEAATVLPWTPVEAWLIDAETALANRARSAARAALERALALAEPMELLHPFVFGPPVVVELVTRQLGSFGPHEAFVGRALRARRTMSALPRSAALTERERAVLQRLPTLQSLEEIASDLTLSLNTIKTHVRSIYAKLGVRSRRDAVNTAHAQGLVELDPSAPGVEDRRSAAQAAVLGASAGWRPGLVQPRTPRAARSPVARVTQDGGWAGCPTRGTWEQRPPVSVRGVGRVMTTNRYEFRVTGRLSERAKGAFDGMEVVDAPAETIIRGTVVDDSHLHGILALLQTMGLHVVAMNEVPELALTAPGSRRRRGPGGSGTR